MQGCSRAARVGRLLFRAAGQSGSILGITWLGVAGASAGVAEAGVVWRKRRRCGRISSL
ncbi:hypothetical protein FE257_004051 [Aspergillus nanangensis]|uniref:Uncharacterized protein n=1 Tax=Aspergillus nanangensis TaxID=2582783 RepID=A0AAD4CBB1_ASPNN|nr:hypothetical protein FE257_004051 [Aspergillus nanangensis]